MSAEKDAPPMVGSPTAAVLLAAPLASPAEDSLKDLGREPVARRAAAPT